MHVETAGGHITAVQGAHLGVVTVYGSADAGTGRTGVARCAGASIVTGQVIGCEDAGTVHTGVVAAPVVVVTLKPRSGGAGAL